MSIIAVALRHMLAAGMDADAIVAAVAEMERQPKPRSAGAVRTQRYRDRKAAEASQTVTCDASDACDAKKVSPEPPSKKDPPSPPKGGSSPAEVNTLTDRLWSLSNNDGRDRSGKHLVRKAVTAALARGATPEALELDIGRHYRQAETGDRDRKGRTFAKGLHRRIEGDHWMTADPPALRPVTPEVQAKRLAHFRDTGEWKPGWGPPPEVGQPPPFRSALAA